MYKEKEIFYCKTKTHSPLTLQYGEEFKVRVDEHVIRTSLYLTSGQVLSVNWTPRGPKNLASIEDESSRLTLHMPSQREGDTINSKLSLPLLS